MCGTKVFCRFREYQRAHTQTPFPWYFQLQEQCLLERQFISLEENKEWINATTREHFIFFINSQFKLVHADSHNVTAMLRKNICFPYRNNKNFPKLSYKILFLLQPVTMQSNHKETFRRIMQKCPPQLMLNCSLQHFEAVSFPMSYGHYILVLRLFFQERFPNPSQFGWNTVAPFLASAASTMWNTITSGRRDPPRLFWPPLLQTRQADGLAGRGQKRVWVLHSLKLSISKPKTATDW